MRHPARTLAAVLALAVYVLGDSSVGTTLIAAKFKDGIVLGTDSRTIMGNFVENRVSNKLQEIYDGIVLCRSGSAADTQHITNRVRRRLEGYELHNGVKPSTRNAAYVTRNICYREKLSLSSDVAMICAGVDGRMFIIPPGGAILEQPFCACGLGSAYIIGFCDAHYREDMEKEECVTCIEKAMTLAMSRDSGSGGYMVLCIITAKGVEMKIHDPRRETVPR